MTESTVETVCRRRRGRLGDGREIILFDDSATVSRPAMVEDRRPLPASAGSASELRWDALRAEWVTVAAHRQSRTFLPADDMCPLCPSSTARRTEIPAQSFDVAVFENRFPAFSPTAFVDDGVPADEFARTAPGIGRCEVVVFTSDHSRPMAELPVRRIRTIVEAWIDRTRVLRESPGVEYVFVFENSGVEIGVTLTHAHGQIYAYPFVPPVAQRQLDQAARHYEATGRDLLGDVLEAERRDGRRIVVETPLWTAFVPFAARWPIEVHLVPNRRAVSLAELTEDERHDLACIYRTLLRRLQALYGRPVPYIAAWHQAPVAARMPPRLHLELFSITRDENKLKYLAGSEAAMGAFISDVLPEAAAARLRSVDPDADARPGETRSPGTDGE